MAQSTKSSANEIIDNDREVHYKQRRLRPIVAKLFENIRKQKV